MIVVIGVGNLDRGDDAAGPAVARRLRVMRLEGAEICELDGEATALLARMEGACAAIFVDASMSGAAPGLVRRFDVVASPLPSGVAGASSHGFGLSEAIELARALGTLPPHCVVYAIEGERFDVSAAMSERALGAVDCVAARIKAEIAQISARPGAVQPRSPA